MKIAIKGHPTRGKEVIQILESLGGKNLEKWHGNGDILDGFFIDNDGSIKFDNLPKEYKLYTLEEFEKEFIFKVGDIVLLKGTNDSFKIIALELFMNKLCYKLDNGLHYSPNKLTTYKEMKEKRNIVLTLNKAKEWYNNGGELREVALQAFTEKELNPLPKSWEEFIELTKFTFNGKLAYIDGIEYWSNGCLPNKSIGESSKIWNKHLALFKLEQLRDCYRQGWKPNWNNTLETKYCIAIEDSKFRIRTHCSLNMFLAFQSVEITREFLKNFEPLIKEAGDLI